MTEEHGAEALTERDLWGEAVGSLTAAARRRRTIAGRDEPADFSSFLASVLASVAANLGSVERVTAGRPGSWESNLVEQLVTGTVGWDGEYLLQHRTEPVRVPLNVPELVEDEGPDNNPPAVSCDEAVDRLPWKSLPEDMNSAEYLRAEEELDQAASAIEARYAAAYLAYAERFRAAVEAQAKTMPGLTTTDPATGAVTLRLPVEVVADTSPFPRYDSDGVSNPDPYEEPDPLVAELWAHARRTVGLPDLTAVQG
ncbi:hypothetical protein [Microlunatus parietis]|uniref:Uncharacterized protein n=2 Tax=Microlunatus parietis TaxID=682979 RepID=A0A7Y9I8E4_9ACTN|nr:hypothetical protein [Microlunatus parietis]